MASRVASLTKSMEKATVSDHLEVDQLILKKYLEAYVRTVGSKNRALNLINFSMTCEGAEKTQQEIRSPVTALEVLLAYLKEIKHEIPSERKIPLNCVTLFCYVSDRQIFDYLQERIRSEILSKYEFDDEDSSPTGNGVVKRIEVRSNEFTISICLYHYESLDFLVLDASFRIPSFIFLDCFGAGALSIDSMSKLFCKFEKPEILINFKVFDIKPVVVNAAPDSRENTTSRDSYDDLFKAIWPGKISNYYRENKNDSEGKKIVMNYMYFLQRNYSMEFATNLLMKVADRGDIERALFFATRHITGLESFKKAVQPVALKEKRFEFSSYVALLPESCILGDEEKNVEKAAELIYEHAVKHARPFRVGLNKANEADDSIECFVTTSTPYAFAKAQLKQLFKQRKIKVVLTPKDEDGNRRDFQAGSFPDDATVVFAQVEETEDGPFPSLFIVLCYDYLPQAQQSAIPFSEMNNLYKHSWFYEKGGNLNVLLNKLNLKCNKDHKKHKDCSFKLPPLQDYFSMRAIKKYEESKSIASFTRLKTMDP